MKCLKLLGGIVIWINNINNVFGEESQDLSWMSNCDTDCWMKTVEDTYDSLLSLYNDENTKELVLSIEDWYQSYYLSYYMNEMKWGKNFDYTNEVDIEAAKRWGKYQQMISKLGESGHTFDDYQKEKITLLGNVGQSYAEKHYGSYDNIDDLDLSFDNFINTFYKKECGTDCKQFIAKLKPYITSNELFESITNDMGVELSMGYEFDVYSYHNTYSIGVSVNGYLNRLALLEKRYAGSHTVGESDGDIEKNINIVSNGEDPDPEPEPEALPRNPGTASAYGPAPPPFIQSNGEDPDPDPEPEPLPPRNPGTADSLNIKSNIKSNGEDPDPEPEPIPPRNPGTASSSASKINTDCNPPRNPGTASTGDDCNPAPRNPGTASNNNIQQLAPPTPQIISNVQDPDPEPEPESLPRNPGTVDNNNNNNNIKEMAAVRPPSPPGAERVKSNGEDPDPEPEPESLPRNPGTASNSKSLNKKRRLGEDPDPEPEPEPLPRNPGTASNNIVSNGEDPDPEPEPEPLSPRNPGTASNNNIISNGEDPDPEPEPESLPRNPGTASNINNNKKSIVYNGEDPEPDPEPEPEALPRNPGTASNNDNKKSSKIDKLAAVGPPSAPGTESVNLIKSLDATTANIYTTLDVSIFSNFDKIEGKSRYLGISSTNGEYEIGASIIETNNELVGVSCTINSNNINDDIDNIEYGDDYVTFIYEYDDESDNDIFDDMIINMDINGINNNGFLPTDIDADDVPMIPTDSDKNKHMNNAISNSNQNNSNDNYMMNIMVFSAIILSVAGLYAFYSKHYRNGKYIEIPDERERRPLIYT